LNFINTNANEIQKIISAMKPKNSHGYDEISLKIIKSSAPYILSPLTYLCNKILLTGIFPDRLKFSEIKSLYKKGDKVEISNYRPISLLPTFSKIIEKFYFSIFIYIFGSQCQTLRKVAFAKKEMPKTKMFISSMAKATFEIMP
jgi:hypothetical protein